MKKETAKPSEPEPGESPSSLAGAAAGSATPTGTASDLPAEPPLPTREEIDDLRARAVKADENWDKFLRAAAELENYRKRAARERQETLRYANEALLAKLVPVLDNFEMALAAASNTQTGNLQSLHAGFSLIYQQFNKVLLDAGLEVIDALGKPFDPNLHEAVSQQVTTDAPEGQVIQQLRKGYKLRDRLIRPASVVVAKPPAPGGAG